MNPVEDLEDLEEYSDYSYGPEDYPEPVAERKSYYNNYTIDEREPFYDPFEKTAMKNAHDLRKCLNDYSVLFPEKIHGFYESKSRIISENLSTQFCSYSSDIMFKNENIFFEMSFRDTYCDFITRLKKNDIEYVFQIDCIPIIFNPDGTTDLLIREEFLDSFWLSSRCGNSIILDYYRGIWSISTVNSSTEGIERFPTEEYVQFLRDTFGESRIRIATLLKFLCSSGMTIPPNFPQLPQNIYSDGYKESVPFSRIPFERGNPPGITGIQFVDIAVETV